jgi:hypothetical protein
LDEHQIARYLAWFSIGVGLTELAAPTRLARALGLQRGARLIQLFGLREVIAGAGILAARRRAPWLWARVAGDALDLAALLAALGASEKRGRVGVAMVNVAAITAIDVICAGQLTREEA